MIDVVVTGGRNFSDESLVRWALDSLHLTFTIRLLIHGDATGADRLCASWATSNDVACRPMPANWSDVSVPDAVIRYRRNGTPYNVLAGFQRNQEMIDIAGPNYAVAFPGGKGTDDMCKRINQARILLWDLRSARPTSTTTS